MTYERRKQMKWLWAIPALLLLSFIISAIGGNTDHYQCKYVSSTQVLVPDHEKYASAAYQINYSDGTKGAVANLSDSTSPAGLDRGAVCKTVFEWGWPYSGTNRAIVDQSSVKSKE